MIGTPTSGRSWGERTAGGGGRTDIAAIDAELDDLGLPQVSPSARSGPPANDQAAALRRLVESGKPATPNARTIVPPPSLPVPARTPRPAPATPVHAAPARSPRLTSDRISVPQTARRARVIAVASGKGGVGKTNITVNTAIMLAKRGLRVTLLDADLGTANADVVCGISPTARLDHVLAPAGLSHQDGGRRGLKDIAINAPGGFRLIPGSAGIGRIADLSTAEREWLLKGMVELAKDADVLLIDTAAGVGASVTSFLQAADLAIVIATPEPTAIADAYALIKCMVMEGEHRRADEADCMALVVNQVRSPVEAFSTHARIAKVCDKFLGVNLPMLGFVAHDLRVGEAVRAQKPLTLAYPYAAATRSISDLSGAIINMLGLLPAAQAGKQGSGKGTSAPAKEDRGVGPLVRRLLGF